MKSKILITVLVLAVLAISSYFILDYIQEPHDLGEIQEAAGGKYIELANGKVHYQILGEKNAPLVVLIGGAGLGYNVWDNNIKALLDNGFKVLRYDHYGRGYSDKVDQDYSLDLFYFQFTELVDSLKLKEPFHLAGLSMGAMVATKFTNNYPEKVNKLILIDPAGINPFKAPFVLTTPFISDLALTFYWRPKAINSQMEEFYEPAKFTVYRKELERQIKLKGYKKVQQSIWLNTLSVDMSAEVENLKNTKKEILLIWGKEDPRTLFETSKFFLDALPKIEFLPVDKAGHLSNYERSEIINPRIIRFLKH